MDIKDAIIKLILFTIITAPIATAIANRLVRSPIELYCEMIQMAHEGDPNLRWHRTFTLPYTRDMLCVPLNAEQLQHIRACTKVERYNVVCRGVEYKSSIFRQYMIISVSVDFSGYEPDAEGNLQPYTLAIEDCHVKFTRTKGAQPPEILGSPTK